MKDKERVVCGPSQSKNRPVGMSLVPYTHHSKIDLLERRHGTQRFVDMVSKKSHKTTKFVQTV